MRCFVPLVPILVALRFQGGAGGSPVNAAKLLANFPSQTVKSLSSLVNHVRLTAWGFNARERTVECEGVKLVVPPSDSNDEETVLSVDAIAASWSSYKSPVIDLTLSNATLVISLDEIISRRKLGRTNWHRLKESGFPPVFSGAGGGSCGRTLFGQGTSLLPVPRFRTITCHGDCVIQTSATLLGRTVTAGLPQITVPGEMISSLWLQLVEAHGEESDGLTTEETAKALTSLLLRILLQETEASVRGDDGAVTRAVKEGLANMAKEVRLSSSVLHFLPES